MNDVSLVGRLTKDIELKYIPSGTAVAKFTLAVDRGLSSQKKKELETKGKPTADFIRIVVWDKQAEHCAEYLGKGRLVAVSGSIRTSSKKNDDGSMIYYTDVNAYKIEFLDYASDVEDSKENKSKPDEVDPDDFSSVEDDDDIPF